ncbi:MAG: hypothetical protein ABIO70_05985 [Pseudomonadota bacterium]
MPSPRPLHLALLTAFALLAGGAAWLLLKRPPRPREAPQRPARTSSQRTTEPVDPPAAAMAGPPVFPRMAFSGAEVMGINEAVGFPAEASGGLVPQLWMRDTLRRRGEATRGLGSTLVRVSSHAWPYLNFQHAAAHDFACTDADLLFTTLAEQGLEAVVVLGPWPGARTAAFTKRYLPDDMDAYAAWVRQVVERYDGDGVDDMPGLGAPVLAWEVDNEPDLHNSEPPRGLGPDDFIEGFETPEEYAAVLLATARAIRRADPQATVLLAGMYRPMTEGGEAYLSTVLDVPGVRAAVDGISLHCYFSENNLGRVRDTMATARALAPEESIWITETSVPSVGRHRWVNQDWQARMVAGVYGAFLAEGADRVFWHSLTTPPRRAAGQPGGFGSNALLGADEEGGFTDKPAALVYRRLAAHLAEVDMASVHEEPAQGGRLLATDRGWLAFWGAPTPPAEARGYHDLLTDARGHLIGPVAAPAWLEP